MNIFQRMSVTLYAVWILFESICSLTRGSPNGWRGYVSLEIFLAYFVCFLFCALSSHGMVQVELCFRGVLLGHQLVLVSISFCKVFVRSCTDRVWHGLRLLTIAICALMHLSSTTGWIDGFLKEES